MNLTEKVAYLKGLMDGMNLDQDDNTVKLIRAVVEVLDEMALTVSDLEDEVAEMEVAFDAMDEDLADMEDTFYGMPHDHDEPHYEVECPVCGEQFLIDDLTALKGETICPECEAEIQIEIDEDEDENEE